MSLSIILTKRAGGRAELVRAEGNIPGVLYGAGGVAISVSAPLRAFASLYSKAGESTLVDLVVDGVTEKGLIQDVQYDAVTGNLIHVDFRRIDMNKEMTATIPLHFVGEAPAIKGLGGTLVEALKEIVITCLPKDLVSSIDVDISVLTGFDQTIRVADLKLPAGSRTAMNGDTAVAKVSAPLTEDELKALESGSAPVDLSKIEVEEKGKKDVPAEGAEETEEKAPAAK